MNKSRSLPLFYKDPVLLRFEEHGDAGLLPASGVDFVREAVAIPLCVGEFSVALRHFPIVFTMDERALPIALVGIRHGANLFVGKDGHWNPGSYVPAYIRRYPFITAETEDGSQQLLAVDRGSDRYVASAAGREGAERLFDEAGGPTKAALSAMALCHVYQADYASTAAFSQALLAENVLTSYQLELRLPDSARHRLKDFYVVDEKAFRALPVKTITDWHAKGWLGLVILHLASQQSYQILLDLHARRESERKAPT
ncbi:MAG: SapC family protein [Burkholderiales bacterium]|nr:SapC family protein [Burkholderiales bacterium]